MPLTPASIRVVFFDLDDTLLDTAGTLVAPALADAAEHMRRAGLGAETGRVEEFLLRRVAEARGGDYFTDAARAFGAPEPQAGAIAAAGRRAYFRRDIPPLDPLPLARRLLAALRQRHAVFLVTAGDPDTQRRKVARLGFEACFDAVRAVDSDAGESKEATLRELMEQAGAPPAACVCVGDRVTGEIRDANRLGMWTIRLRRGEFAAMEPQGPDERPDFTVGDLDGVARILAVELEG